MPQTQDENYLQEDENTKSDLPENLATKLALVEFVVGKIVTFIGNKIKHLNLIVNILKLISVIAKQFAETIRNILHAKEDIQDDLNAHKIYISNLTPSKKARHIEKVIDEYKFKHKRLLRKHRMNPDFRQIKIEVIKEALEDELALLGKSVHFNERDVPCRLEDRVTM